MSESELKKLFSSHGIVVKNVHIISDHYTRQSKCFGYVEMQCKKEMSKAVDMLHGKAINKRLLVVKEARSRDERHGQLW
jgi:RNA recognition motif-containing protein